MVLDKKMVKREEIKRRKIIVKDTCQSLPRKGREEDPLSTG